ncbi:MAG: hypothetical protein UCH28_08335, partial [Adlercreutzia sp.]|nr:hypothetical protein [Adlercreutzia sp.]
MRTEGNTVELFEEVADETDDTATPVRVTVVDGDGTKEVTVRTDGYVIVSAEITDKAETVEGGQYQMSNGTAAASGAAVIGAEVFYNGKRYDVPRTVDTPLRGGDAGLVELLKANISGRVWNDVNYDGLQATKIAMVDGESVTVVDNDAEPGIENEEIRLSQWMYVPKTKWADFVENHDDLVRASFGLTEGIGEDANGNGKLDKDEIAASIEKGVWIRNTLFGEERYTAYTTTTTDENGKVTTTHKPYMTDSWYSENGIVSVNTSAGEDVSLTKAAKGVYLFDKLPTVCVVQNKTYDEFYLAAYRVEIPAMNVTDPLDATVTGSEKDTWLLTRHRATTGDAMKSINFDSDVKDLTKTGIAGGYIVSQQNDYRDTNDETKPAERQNNGQIILSTLVDEKHPGNQNTTEDVENNNNMWEGDDVTKYDWMLELPDGTALHHGGDIGEVLPCYETITGTVWMDKNNNGLQGKYKADDGSEQTEPGMNGIKVSLERYYYVADDADAEWTWDTQWADPYPTDYTDKTQAKTSPMKPAVAKGWTKAADGSYTYTEMAYANTETKTVDGADGTYEFKNLKSSDIRLVKDGKIVDAGTDGAKQAVVIYGYKVRVTDPEFRGRHLLAANVHESSNPATPEDYTIDSDLNYNNGYLMEENEYAVLLNVEDTQDYVDGKAVDAQGNPTNTGSTAVSVKSQSSNLVTAGNSLNPNQNEADRYGRMPEVSAVKTTDEATAPATLRYDRAKGASRKNNDAGIMEIPKHYIAGYVWRDANYDGIYDEAADSFAVDGTTYTEEGLVGKKVILKQWYFKPATDAQGDATGEGGEWVQVTNFTNIDPTVGGGAETVADVLAVVASVAAQAADAVDADGAVVCSTLTKAAEGEGEKATRDGYYYFGNLPVYVAVEGTEYLAGYTVEVVGGTAEEALNVPVTKIEEPQENLEKTDHQSTAQVIGTQLLASANVTYTDDAATHADVDTYANTNYPLGWMHQTGQAPKMFDNDVTLNNLQNTSNSTLDGMIVLAGNTTDYTQEDNYKVDQVREDADGNKVTVSFDMATGRDEDKLSGGFGYFGTTEVSGTVWFDADFDGIQEIGAKPDGDYAIPDQTVELTQWYYLAGSVVDGKFVADEVKNNKSQVLRSARTYELDITDTHVIELVRDADDKVIGAWIKNPAFGEEITETVEGEDGASTTTVTGYTGKFTMKTDANGAFAFNDANTKGLLSYVQFDAEGNPLAAGDPAATDDVLALAAYRVTEPTLPAGHVLTVYHNNEQDSSTAWATNTDSDAKRDVLRSAMVDGYDTPIVTSYPQFEAEGEQPDKGFAGTTGYILTANSETPAANTPYTLTMGEVNYDVANRVAKRQNVNTGLFKIPTSQITGLVWDDTEHEDNTASDGVRADDEPGLIDQTVLATQWYYVPKGAAAFEQIETGEAAGIVEWVAADGSKSTSEADRASAVGAWVQNVGFGSDWVSTQASIVKNPVLGEDGEDTGEVTETVVRVPVVTNGVSQKDAAGKAAAVAVKTLAGGVRTAKDEDGNDVTLPQGSYVFDNLPTAVVKYNTATGTDEYFLAAYRVELQSTNNYPTDPWHLTSQNQGAGLTVDSNAVAAEIGVAGNAEEAGVAGTEHEDYYHSYPVIER